MPLPSSTKGRIIASNGLLVLVLIAVVASATLMERHHDSHLATAASYERTALALEDARFQSAVAAWLLERYIVTGDEALAPILRRSIADAKDSLSLARALEEEHSSNGQYEHYSEEESAGLDLIAEGLAKLSETAEVVIGLRQTGDIEGARAALEQQVSPMTMIGVQLRDAADFERQEAASLRGQADHAGQIALWLLVGFGAAGAVLGTAASALMARSILKPLSSLESTTLAVADGDLEARAPATGPQELVRLGASFNRMTDSLVKDIARRERAEEQLRQSEERYRDLFESTSDIIQSVAMDGSYVYVNRAWRETLGYGEEEIRSLNMLDIVHPDSKEHCMAMFQRVMAGESLDRIEAEFVTKQGRSIWVEGSTFAQLQDGKPVATRGIFRDVTERKQAEEAVRHLAYHDPLTDLPNRTLFRDRLDVALAQARRHSRLVAVALLDLDHFKVVNDTAGHPEGDDLLRTIAAQLRELTGEGDTVARVGGDEFLLLLPAVERIGDAIEVVERVVEEFRRPRFLGGHEFRITPSIGIAVFPNHGDDAETLLRNADIAMYSAKEHGRNNHQLFSPAMSASILDRLALENDLRHALEREEFVIHYQPQVHIQSGRIVGVEALVRWQHPKRGLVMPTEFIPVAEETGLIAPLGEWILRTACAQTKVWQDAALPRVRVGVNLSARQFQQRDLVERVRQVLQETGLDAHFLQLEITESVAIQDVDYSIMMLRQLRQMGIEIAIDDFGTGQSSLSYLRRLPIDAVKVDLSFVRNVATNPRDAEITATVIHMAHNLKLGVVAEGVETEEQLAFLERELCDEVQGFLFSRPVDAEELEEVLLRTWSEAA